MARTIAAAIAAPPVARVVVPTSGTGPENHGSFCAVSLADGSTGLAYVLLGDTRRRLERSDAAARVGRDALSLIEGITGDDPAARSLGLAALNALSRHVFDRAGFVPDLASSSFGSLALGAGDRLGMVGYFPPLVERARQAGIPLTVLELKEELVEDAPDLRVTLDPAGLAGCTHIVCTSTVLLNDTLDDVLGFARGARELAIVGPSAGFVPDPLFRRGVTSIGGAWVVDPADLATRVGRGERFGAASRKFSLRRDGWQGLDALLARAAGCR